MDFTSFAAIIWLLVTITIVITGFGVVVSGNPESFTTFITVLGFLNLGVLICIVSLIVNWCLKRSQQPNKIETVQRNKPVIPDRPRVRNVQFRTVTSDLPLPTAPPLSGSDTELNISYSETLVPANNHHDVESTQDLEEDLNQQPTTSSSQCEEIAVNEDNKSAKQNEMRPAENKSLGTQSQNEC